MRTDTIKNYAQKSITKLQIYKLIIPTIHSTQREVFKGT